MRGTLVYIVEAEQGLVKIGYSQNPRGRAASVLTHSPLKTRLIAQWRGTRKEELAIHKKFLALKYHNEWFRCEGDLEAFVETKRGVGLTEAIPAWDEIGSISKESTAAKRSAAHKAIWADPKYRKERMRSIKRQAAIRRECKAKNITYEEWHRMKYPQWHTTRAS